MLLDHKEPLLLQLLLLLHRHRASIHGFCSNCSSVHSFQFQSGRQLLLINVFSFRQVFIFTKISLTLNPLLPLSQFVHYLFQLTNRGILVFYTPCVIFYRSRPTFAIKSSRPWILLIFRLFFQFLLFINTNRRCSFQ